MTLLGPLRNSKIIFSNSGQVYGTLLTSFWNILGNFFAFPIENKTKFSRWTRCFMSNTNQKIRKQLHQRIQCRLTTSLPTNSEPESSSHKLYCVFMKNVKQMSQQSSSLKIVDGKFKMGYRLLVVYGWLNTKRCLL